MAGSEEGRVEEWTRGAEPFREEIEWMVGVEELGRVGGFECLREGKGEREGGDKEETEEDM